MIWLTYHKEPISNDYQPLSLFLSNIDWVIVGLGVHSPKRENNVLVLN